MRIPRIQKNSLQSGKLLQHTTDCIRDLYVPWQNHDRVSILTNRSQIEPNAVVWSIITLYILWKSLHLFLYSLTEAFAGTGDHDNS